MGGAHPGLTTPTLYPRQVPWLTQSRSPLPSHARSQPGLCNMYKVRRGRRPLLPLHVRYSMHRVLRDSPISRAGGLPRVLLCPVAQQIFWGIFELWQS